jgi:RNA-binding protein
MKPLTSSQAKFLRGLAHNLKPVVFIGQKGITTALLESIREALAVHELIKVRFIDSPDKRRRADG